MFCKKENSLRFYLVSLIAFFISVSVQAETVATVPSKVNFVYQISNLAELRWVSENSSSWGSHFVVTANIDATETATWNGGLGFSPIGNSTAFTGSFSNAGNFVIDKLTINRPDEDQVGLFGRLGSHFDGLNSLALTNASVIGNDYVGGLVGYTAYTSITGCYVTGSVVGNDYVGGLIGNCSYGSSVVGSYVTGSVVGDTYVGGLIGYDSSSVVDSYATSSVVGDTYVGGLIGYDSSSSTSGCHATGSVIGGFNVGGLIGSSSSVENSYATGSVSGDNTVGGLVGICKTSSIVDSHATGSVSGQQSVGGLIGNFYSDSSVENSHATGEVEGSTFVGGLIGVSHSVSSVVSSYATGSVRGESHVGGLLGYSQSGSSIESSYATGSVSGERSVGGLVGFSLVGSSIESCYATGSVIGDDESENVGGLVGSAYAGSSITGSYATGSVSGRADVGGLVGENSGLINGCYAKGSVSGDVRIGGLVGNAYLDSSIADSFAVGLVNGYYFVGGLIGSNLGSISNSFFDITTTAIRAEDGVGNSVNHPDITGYTTEDIQMPSNYTEWNFTETWYMTVGSYPVFRWQVELFDVEFIVGANGTATGSLEQEVISGQAAVAPIVTANSGWIFIGWNTGDSANVLSDLTLTAQYERDFTAVPRYRLYNVNDGNHHWTTNEAEYDFLVSVGWSGEGYDHRIFTQEIALAGETTQPYGRLYNPNNGEHHWTFNTAEYDFLGSVGWVQEGDDGFVFLAQAGEMTALYRLYNPNSGLHHYTANEAEYNLLVDAGWNDEGVSAWVFPATSGI